MISFVFLTSASFISACSGHATEPPHVTNEAASSATRWVAVTLPNDESLVEAAARVVASPDASAEVTTTFRARVVRVHVQPGDRVEAGAPIADVVAPELLDAAAKLRASTARIAAFAGRRSQLEQLRSEGLVERGRVFELSAQIAELEAERDRASAELRGAGLEGREVGGLLQRGSLVLRTPVAGTVREVHAVRGAVLEPGAAPIAVVVGEGSPRIEARFSSGLPRGVRFDWIDSRGESQALAAEPTNTLVVPEDGTLLAWFELEDRAVRLPSGMVGRVRVRSVAAGVLQVPRASLRGHGAGAVVMVRVDRGPPREVHVEVLATSGSTALVRGELKPDDYVAADVVSVLGRGESDDHG